MDGDRHQVYLGLGSNLGNREETILAAYKEIERLIGVIVRQSAFFYSEPWGFQSEHPFANSVILVETTLSPHEVLHHTQHIERLLGKRRRHATKRDATPTKASPRGGLEGASLTSHPSPLTSQTYHDRPIDIDILLYDDVTIDEPDLKIPHPLMQERDFVMIPLREIREQ